MHFFGNNFFKNQCMNERNLLMKEILVGLCQLLSGVHILRGFSVPAGKKRLFSQSLTEILQDRNSSSKPYEIEQYPGNDGQRLLFAKADILRRLNCL